MGRADVRRAAALISMARLLYITRGHQSACLSRHSLSRPRVKTKHTIWGAVVAEDVDGEVVDFPQNYHYRGGSPRDNHYGTLQGFRYAWRSMAFMYL